MSSISSDGGDPRVRPGSSVSLVAMPGAGKSTAGRHLAAALGWRFVDADVEIEQRIGMSIRAYFEREGEQAFRDLEQQVIAELVQIRPPIVLATGGGSVLREANRRALKENSVVVYLRASPEELFRRLRHCRARLSQRRTGLRQKRSNSSSPICAAHSAAGGCSANGAGGAGGWLRASA